MAVVGPQFGDRADRETRREASAQARGHHHVADLDVARHRDVAHLQPVAAADAVGHQAHAGARDRHRHRVVEVGQQQHRRGAGRHRDDLADQAAGIDHALALAHAVVAAGIEHQALARGIEVDVEDRRQLHVQPPAPGRAQQAAQARVLVGLDLQPRLARAHHQQLVAQAPVVLGQHRARGGVLAHRLPQPRRQSRDLPQRLHRDVRGRARAREPVAAMVEHDQHHRQRQVRQQAQRPGDVAGTGGGGTGEGGHLRAGIRDSGFGIRNSGTSPPGRSRAR